MVEVIKGNKREIPGDMPPGLWWDRVRECRAEPVLLELPWFLPELEYLTPDALAQMRAKARVWLEVTGELPKDINCWWEVRCARRCGEIPQRGDWAMTQIDEANILHCGECGARYSTHHDGTHSAERCNLCGVRWVKMEATCKIIPV